MIELVFVCFVFWLLGIFFNVEDKIHAPELAHVQVFDHDVAVIFESGSLLEAFIFVGLHFMFKLR
jgi:hypothetical protein